MSERPIEELKHVGRDLTDKYFEILDEVDRKGDMFMFNYIGENEEVQRTKEIIACSVYRYELIPYIEKYTYEEVNRFVLERTAKRRGAQDAKRIDN